MSAYKRIKVAGIMLLAAALILLLMSACSPLYPTNPWSDPNCFHTMARGILQGKLPYRDLIEQKGPLLYYLHVPAVLLHPQGFFGVYLLEVLCLTAFLYLAWRMMALFGGEKCWPLTLLAGVAIVSADAFVWGDSAEELCAPLMLWSLYDAMRYFLSDERKMSAACLVRNGVLVGCVLWTKFSLLGLHFAWMAVIAIEALVREKSILRPLRMCALFLLGMLLSSLPWLILYAANGALGDLWQIYFVQNTLGYHRDINLFKNIVNGVLGGSRHNLFMAAMIASGTLYLLLAKRLRGKVWLKVTVVAMMLCAGVFTYSGGWRHDYYYMIFASFVPLGCIALARLWEIVKAHGKGRIGATVMAGMCAIVACVAVGCCQNLYAIGTDRAEMPQVKFAKIISETENASLLNCCFLDDGFYLAAEVEPENRWFCMLLANKDECYAEQSEMVAQGATDYVVTWKHTLNGLGMDGTKYELAAKDALVLDRRHTGDLVYLYRRVDG